MADVISMIAGIGSILKAFGSTGVYLRSVSNASKEAQLIADQLHATEAILKALKTSLEVSPPSSSSYAAWADSMNLVLGKVRSIIDNLNTKLSSQRGVVRLSFRKKVMWPFDKEDSAALLENLKAYWHMISIAQTSLTSGNAQTVQKSAREIDDMLTQVGNRHPSTMVRSNAKTITPWDSVSQISVQSSETKSSLVEKAVGIWCQRGNARERSGEQKRLQKAKPPFTISESSWTPPVYLNTYEASIELSSLRFRRRGSQATEPRELGQGSLTLAITQDGSRIRVYYSVISTSVPYECQLNPQNPGMDIITNNSATFRWPVSENGYESTTEEILTLTFYNAYGKPADECKTNFLFMLNTLCKEAKKVQGMSMRQRRKAASLQGYSRLPNFYQLEQTITPTPSVNPSNHRHFLTDA